MLKLLTEAQLLATGRRKGGGWYLTPNGNQTSSAIAASAVAAGMKTLVFVQTTEFCESCVKAFPARIEPTEVALTEAEERWRDLTVEEMVLLGDLARYAGLQRNELNSRIAEIRADEDFRESQIDLVTRDVEATMKKMIQIGRAVGSHDEAHVAMLLWRVAARLEMSTERFEELFAAS